MSYLEDRIDVFIENSIKEIRFDSNIKKTAILQLKRLRRPKYNVK